MSQLFSEIYGCYFGIVSRILSNAADGISKKEIDDIVNKYGFSETPFHLLPQLISGEWNFLEKRGDLYYSRFNNQIGRPVSKLELSWLASIIIDPRFKLFLSDKKYIKLTDILKDIAPLFDTTDFISIDRHLDGDQYYDSTYIANFKKILDAIKNNYPITITYDSEKTGRSERTYHPFKLSYSELNDKFRLLCAAFNTKTQKLNKITLNLGKIVSVEPSQLPYRLAPEDLCKLFTQPCENPPTNLGAETRGQAKLAHERGDDGLQPSVITLEITKERNSLERFLLQFASFDRKTEYDPDRDIYTCQISYDMADETELLIRILSFGPTVKVLGPQSFLNQIKERIAKQICLMHGNPST